MSPRTRLTSIDLWGRHERTCLEVLREALAQLALEEAPGTCEPAINRTLYLKLRRAAHAAARGGRTEARPWHPEARNAPSALDEGMVPREHKIPDFQCGFVDHLAANPDAGSKMFVVECKRLSQPSRNWIYTREYVVSGIERFIHPEHGYGWDTPSGAMVGYLQVLGLDDALREVNVNAEAASVPPILVIERQGEDSAELEHELTRSFPDSPFRLLHLWVRLS